ncbi:transcriptional regulator, GntR family [Oribacterium sp. oral taxon 078 str. F0262]|nr:transcriptional regulator, GntR family [Oribacterium sp. oral taxon 078 str. F0262]
MGRKGREGGLKKYQKVKAYLYERIMDGSYVPERPLPPERELAATLGVNRMTLRRAVEELSYDGYLIRKKGSGTYLTSEKVRKDELIAEKGAEEQQAFRLISCALCRERGYGSRMLELSEDSEEGYWRIRRSRYLNHLPFAYEDIYLRERFFPAVDVSYYAVGLHRMVQEKGGELHPLRQQQVEALLCLKTTGKILNVREGSPILQIKTWFYRARDEEPMLFCRSYHPGDSYTFRSRKIVIK